MKKALILTLVLMLFSLALVACGEETDLCLHEWQEEVNEDLLVSPATCATPAKYWSSCKKCGEKGEIFEYGELSAHEFGYIVNEQTLATPATCTDLASYYESCKWCGEINKDKTFVSGVCLPHTFVNVANKDTICSRSTCSTPFTYYKSCEECGLLSDETFTLGPTLPHADSHGDDVCDLCDKPLKVYDDVSVDNLTGIHHFKKD